MKFAGAGHQADQVDFQHFAESRHLELAAPVLTEAARSANFTNEAGVDRTTRFLRNVMGLWLLQECVRTWNSLGLPADLDCHRADSLGLQLVDDLTQQLHGTIVVNRDGGTTFTITFDTDRRGEREP